MAALGSCLMSISRHVEYRLGSAKGVTWTVKGGRVLGPAPFLVMGIVNATPDSFFDGGVNFDPTRAAACARQLLADGAALVDLGGESTRPSADPVSETDELRRVMPVVEDILTHQPDAVVSVDTYKAHVAERALAAGASIVNDVSAFSFDPGLLDVVAQHKPGYVLMHSLGRPKTMQIKPIYTDVLAEIARFFESRMTKLVKAGLPEDRIVLDPGIGFGKTLEHNLTILRGLESFTQLGRPLFMGLSNKSFLGELLGLNVADRGTATLVATAMSYLHGAFIHRVHDAAGAVQALTLAEAMC